MRSVPFSSLKTTIRQGSVIAILTLAASCDSTVVEPDPAPQQEPAIIPIVRGQMVFVDQRSAFFSIFLADSTGTRLKILTLGNSYAFDPAVSTDGKKIAFSSHPGNGDGRDIWVMNADGSNQVRLTHTGNANTPSSSSAPAWSPDGNRIAFVTSTGLWEHQIFVMNADGSDVKQITRDDDAYSLAPEWSPDGRRILFSHFPTRIENAGIFEMDADGSNVRQLTSGYFASAPTRSPDGTRVAFISGESLFVMNADGSNAVALTSGVDWDGEVTWSPDGRSIVFGITSNSKMCYYEDFEEYACGRDLKRVALDGAIFSNWEVTSAFSATWQP